MITSEIPELLGMCAGICVVNEGTVAGELTAAETTQARIMSMRVNQAEAV